ncbi:MAG: hypothetical protein K6T59_14180 [Bryobacteraceae bacterium]|nr:hypothetical protein [Bryobacteraceae bacterium]
MAAMSVWQATGMSVTVGGEATSATHTRSAAGAASEAVLENGDRKGATGGTRGERLREGTRLVDVVGTFQPVGADGISFSPRGSKESYRVLENLALERIARALDESRGTRLWVVSGLITEYRGANYLLISKAVMQADESGTAR